MAFYVASKHDQKQKKKAVKCSPQMGEKKGPYSTHNNSAQTGII